LHIAKKCARFGAFFLLTIVAHSPYLPIRAARAEDCPKGQTEVPSSPDGGGSGLDHLCIPDGYIQANQAAQDKDSLYCPPPLRYCPTQAPGERCIYWNDRC